MVQKLGLMGHQSRHAHIHTLITVQFLEITARCVMGGLELLENKLTNAAVVLLKSYKVQIYFLKKLFLHSTLI